MEVEQEETSEQEPLQLRQCTSGANSRATQGPSGRPSNSEATQGPFNRLSNHSSLLTTDPMSKLNDCIMGLCKIQESAIQQIATIQQRKIDGHQTIHYTGKNTMKQLGTMDENSPAPSITLLAKEILGAKRRDTADNVLILYLNDKGVCCQVIPQLAEALCTCNLVPKNPFEPAAFGPFAAATSFTGLRI